MATADEVRRRMTGTPLYATLGIDLTHLAPGEAAVALVVDARHCNVDGSLHGGLYGLLADTAMGFAARTVQEDGTVNKTLELSVSFLAAAGMGDRVTARARVARRGTPLTWTEAEIIALGAEEAERDLGKAHSLNYEVPAPPS